MEHWFYSWVGDGEPLLLRHMVVRTFIVFVWVLLCIRIAGRRSFGLRTPLDSIVTILLGALLSKAITGSAPLVPTLFSGFVLALLHRLLALASLKWLLFSRILNGKRICVYADGDFVESAMKRALLSERDVMQGVRVSTGSESLEGIDKIYLERNGAISIIRKK